MILASLEKGKTKNLNRPYMQPSSAQNRREKPNRSANLVTNLRLVKRGTTVVCDSNILPPTKHDKYQRYLICYEMPQS